MEATLGQNSSEQMESALDTEWRNILLKVLPLVFIANTFSALSSYAAEGHRFNDFYIYAGIAVFLVLAQIFLLLRRQNKHIFTLVMYSSSGFFVLRFFWTIFTYPAEEIPHSFATGMIWLAPVVVFGIASGFNKKAITLSFYLLTTMTVLFAMFYLSTQIGKGINDDFVIPFQILTSNWLVYYALHRYLNARGKYFQKVGHLETLQELAYVDSLTQLPNRNRLDQFIEEHIKNSSAPLSVILLNIDDFKSLNATLGHDSGDALLTKLGQALLQTIHPEMLVVRIGGDEFVIAAPKLNSKEATAFVRHSILAMNPKDNLLSPADLFAETAGRGVTFSVGICSYPNDANNSKELMRNADIAMLAVKQSGRNNIRCYSPQDDTSSKLRRALSNGMSESLERQEMFMVFQPIVNLRNNRIAKVEALMRWKHPQHGLVSPLDFIPLAEENGFIHSLGMWSIAESLRLASAWPSLKLSVNLSVYQLLHPDFFPQLEQLLSKYTHAKQLEFELTETVTLNENDQILDVLQSLNGLSIPLAIDDFGTGYSSLSRTLSWPIQGIKIDRSLISGLQSTSPRGQGSQAVIESIMQIKKVLNQTITAEGVEEFAQAQILQAMGCDFAQGYLFGRPMSPDDISVLIAQEMTQEKRETPAKIR